MCTQENRSNSNSSFSEITEDDSTDKLTKLRENEYMSTLFAERTLRRRIQRHDSDTLITYFTSDYN